MSMHGRPGARTVALGASVLAIALVPVVSASAQDPAHREGEMAIATQQIQIPDAMRQEHAELHAALVEATRQPGRVGEAAREVAAVLHPHFVREEQIALPPLGLLAALARGDVREEMTAVFPMTDALKAELPQMLEEHRKIRAAVEKLARVAREDGSPEYAGLAEKIMLHAKTEEQVTYPAAVLVGEYLRAWLGR